MHGAVLLDAQCISRSIRRLSGPTSGAAPKCDDLIALIGAQHYTHIAGTLPATGFMAATLLWLRRHDPALLDQVAQVLLPKDYVRLKMTGSVATDASDAAAIGLIRHQRQNVVGGDHPRAGLAGRHFPAPARTRRRWRAN